MTVGLVLHLCGCDTAAGPSAAPIAGTFVLIAVNGQPLPYVSSSPSGLIESRLFADTLVFAANGTGTGTSTGISRNMNTNIETSMRMVRTFRHSRDGDRVMLDSLRCGENCTLSVDRQFFDVRDNGLNGSVGVRYERVSP